MDVLCWSLGHQQPCYFPQRRCLFWQRKCPNVRFLKCSRVATACLHFISRRHRRYAFNEDGSQAWMFQSQWCVLSPLNQKCVGDLPFGSDFFAVQFTQMPRLLRVGICILESKFPMFIAIMCLSDLTDRYCPGQVAGYVTALNANGTKLWEVSTPGEVWSSAVANPSETTVRASNPQTSLE